MTTPRWNYRLLPALALLLGASAHADHAGSELLRLHFIDVGQGDAIWIQTPVSSAPSQGAGPTTAANAEAGLNILIDGGPDRGAANRVVKYLSTYRLPPGSVIDYMFVTHPHDDHHAGLLDILERYDVRNIIDSGFPKDGVRFKQFLDAARAEKVEGQSAKLALLRSDTAPALDWGGVDVQILYSDRADLTGMGGDNTRENNASTVLRVAYGNFSFLLMGDAEGKERNQAESTLRFVEQRLLQKYQPAQLRSTVLKAGHHGSETGSTLQFLQAVNPEVVVVMSGRKSFSGTFLPDATVLERYRRVRPDVTVVRTDYRDAEEGRDTTDDEDGDDLLFYTDGESLRVYQSRLSAGARRWRLIKKLQ